MNSQATNTSATTSATTSGKQGEDPSTTIGVGGVTSGQSGATPSHETQRETGGSGGEQLTASQDGGGPANANVQPAAGSAPAGPAASASEPDDSSMQSGARGAFDTRSGQGGGTGTGLGSPESGANQSEADLPPASQDRTDGSRASR